MIGLGTLVKMAKGGVDKDMLEEVAEQMGLQINMMPLPEAEMPPTFTELFAKSVELGTGRYLISGRSKDGTEFSAVFILVPSKSVPALAS